MVAGVKDLHSIKRGNALTQIGMTKTAKSVISALQGERRGVKPLNPPLNPPVKQSKFSSFQNMILHEFHYLVEWCSLN